MKNILLALTMVCAVSLAACGSSDPAAPAQKPPRPEATEPAVLAQDKPASDGQGEPAAGPNAAKIALEVAALQEVLLKKYPDLTGSSLQINKVDLGSAVLFEIVTEDVVFYTNPTADYILSGSLFLGEGKEVVNFTNRLNKAPEPVVEEDTVDGRAVFDALPFAAGLNYTFGKPTYKIAVFEDPDCAFCQAFHKDLKEFGNELNVQITVFPFVLESQHPLGVARAKALMCTTDPAKSWNDWMLAAEGLDAKTRDALWVTWSPTNAPVPSCPQSGLVDMWQNVGKQLGFSATPTIMFENGAVLEGRPSKDDLVQALADAKKQREEADKANLATVSPAAPASSPEQTPAPIPAE